MKWKGERQEMRECIKELEMRVREIEGTTEGESEEVDLKGGKKGGGRIVENRLTEIERRIEIKEREERRKNIIIKVVEEVLRVKEGKRRKAVEEVLKVMIGVKTEMEEIRKLRERRRKIKRCCW